MSTVFATQCSYYLHCTQVPAFKSTHVQLGIGSSEILFRQTPVLSTALIMFFYYSYSYGYYIYNYENYYLPYFHPVLCGIIRGLYDRNLALKKTTILRLKFILVMEIFNFQFYKPSPTSFYLLCPFLKSRLLQPFKMSVRSSICHIWKK